MNAAYASVHAAAAASKARSSIGAALDRVPGAISILHRQDRRDG
jgi:hypothetical protein